MSCGSAGAGGVQCGRHLNARSLPALPLFCFPVRFDCTRSKFFRALRVAQEPTCGGSSAAARLPIVPACQAALKAARNLLQAQEATLFLEERLAVLKSLESSHG